MTRVFDRISGEQLAVLDGWPADVDADGTVVHTYAEEPLTWDLSGGQPDEPFTAIPGFRSATLTPDGSKVSQLVDANHLVLDTRTGEEIGQLPTGLGNTDRPVHDQDGTRLVVADGIGGNAVVFDFETPRELATLQLCELFFAGVVDVAGDVTTVRADCDDNNLPSQFIVDSETFSMRTAIQQSAG